MAAGKKPAKMANRNVGQEEPVIKDDGVKYTAVSAQGRRVYEGPGVGLPEAVRLARGLLAPSGVARVEPDGSLTFGRVDLQAGVFIAPSEEVPAAA